jgi:hypothetical protein
MNRRDFLKDLGFAAGALALANHACDAASIAETTYDFQTKHVVWIINGSGSRKKDWYANPGLSPNLAQLAKEGFVYEESHNETVCNHEHALAELLSGHRHALGMNYPTAIDYVRGAYHDASNCWFLSDRAGLADPLAAVPHILKEFKPRLIICRITAHDLGHGNHGQSRLKTGQYEYFNVCRQTDEKAGRIIDFIKNDPYFSSRSALVIRPEFGRDDEPNMYGEIHHSAGFYQTHRSAEIWWGPDFKVGVDKGVKNRIDFAPSLIKLFNIDVPKASGRVHPEMFKTSLGEFPAYADRLLPAEN